MQLIFINSFQKLFTILACPVYAQNNTTGRIVNITPRPVFECEYYLNMRRFIHNLVRGSVMLSFTYYFQQILQEED